MNQPRRPAGSPAFPVHHAQRRDRGRPRERHLGARGGGPALGGVLYTVDATTVYSAGTVLLLIAFGLTLAVRYAHQPSHSANTLRSVFAGVSFVWTNKVLLGAMSLDLFAVLLGAPAVWKESAGGSN